MINYRSMVFLEGAAVTARSECLVAVDEYLSTGTGLF